MGGLCTGVMAAYSVHLQATLPNATLPFTREADVVAEGLALEGTLYCAHRVGIGD